jgi:hypothetical protein
MSCAAVPIRSQKDARRYLGSCGASRSTAETGEIALPRWPALISCALAPIKEILRVGAGHSLVCTTAPVGRRRPDRRANIRQAGLHLLLLIFLFLLLFQVSTPIFGGLARTLFVVCRC